MAESSGLDSLLDALRQSGVDVGDMTGAKGSHDGGGASSSAQTNASYTTGDSSSAKASGKRPQGGSHGASRGGASHGPGFPFPFGTASSDGSDGFDPSNIGGEIDGFADRVRDWGKKTRTVAVVVLIVVLLAAYWWFHPPISINSVDTWTFVAVFVLLPIFMVFRTRSRAYETGTRKVESDKAKSKRYKTLSFIPVAVVVLGLVGAIVSLDLFPGNAARYANVLQTQQLDFTSDIQEVNYSEIPVIDHDSAVLLGNREMGSIPEYVSQFEIDNLYSQINYQGTPVRVSPLGYADLFKWLTNRDDGIPAYAIVDMTTQDAEVVTLEQGMKYTASEPLARNIDRYVQLKHPFYIFDTKSFEIDDDGQPWWICPVRSYTIGLFGGETISRVVLCNAVTGECIDYAIEDVPQWVDRAYPSDLLIRQYNWSGSYINGWFNSWLGQSGVYQTTPGTNGENGYNYIAKDDDVWVYTGVTSATSDNSIIGFVLINQRTAESHYYAVAGATEESAMQSAEGQVQNLRYSATFPLLINVANQPTYFMALKDAAGLVKQFAMVDIQRYQNVAVGDTVASCQKSYEALLATNGVLAESDAADLTNLQTASGVIRTMAQAVIEGNSHFYVTLENDSHIYDFALPAFVEIAGYGVGDKIEFSYVESDPTSPAQAITSKDSSAGDVSASQQGSSSGVESKAYESSTGTSTGQGLQGAASSASSSNSGAMAA